MCPSESKITMHSSLRKYLVEERSLEEKTEEEHIPYRQEIPVDLAYHFQIITIKAKHTIKRIEQGISEPVVFRTPEKKKQKK